MSPASATLPELFTALGSPDDERIRVAVVALEQRLSNAEEQECHDIANALLPLLTHDAAKVRQAVAAASETLPELFFDTILAALESDHNAYVRHTMKRAAQRRAVRGKIRSVDDERERFVAHALEIVEQRSSTATRKLVERAIDREKEFFVRKLHHEVCKASSNLDITLNRIVSEVAKPSLDRLALAGLAKASLERSDHLMSILHGARAATDSVDATYKEERLVPLVELARAHVIERLGPRASRLAFENTVDGAIVLDAHRPSLLQALQNVFQNAAEAYAEDGTEPVELRVAARTLRSNTVLVLTVADRGSGMSQHRVDGLFSNPFFSRKPGGTGVGLFIVRKLVEQVHGGSLEIASEKGVGTTVTMRLPVRRSAGRAS